MSLEEETTVTKRCVGCGMTMPAYNPYQQGFYRRRGKRRRPNPELTADGQDPQYGSRGDNLCCNMICGHKLLLRLIASVPDILGLLPPSWRPDLLPLEENPKYKERQRRAKRNQRFSSQRRR